MPLDESDITPSLTTAERHIIDFDERLPSEWGNRWPHFKPWELFSPDTAGVDYSSYMARPEEFPWKSYKDLRKVDLLFLDRLEVLRVALGVPLLINDPRRGLLLRGFRSQKEQEGLIERFGGAKDSMHTLFRAVDVTPIEGASLDEVAKMGEQLGFGGIGIYRKRDFVHLDSRSLVTKDRPVKWEL